MKLVSNINERGTLNPYQLINDKMHILHIELSPKKIVEKKCHQIHSHFHLAY